MQISRLFSGPQWIRSPRASAFKTKIGRMHFKTSSKRGWCISFEDFICRTSHIQQGVENKLEPRVSELKEVAALIHSYSSQPLPIIVRQLVYSSQWRYPTEIILTGWQAIDYWGDAVQNIKKKPNIFNAMRGIGIEREKFLHPGRDSPAIWHLLDQKILLLSFQTPIVRASLLSFQDRGDELPRPQLQSLYGSCNPIPILPVITVYGDAQRFVEKSRRL